jgi:hypothetical protein
LNCLSRRRNLWHLIHLTPLINCSRISNNR